MTKYVFKPYSEHFPELFQKERERLAAKLGKTAVIEHVGSTAVPGLGGKGIIDIAIAVKKAELEPTSLLIQTLSYEYRPTYSTPERFYFVTYLPDPEEGQRRYHIHLTYQESSDWKGLIEFRDLLRSSPEDLVEYAATKKQAALETDKAGDTYRKLKEPIFQKARKHREPQ